MQKYSAFVFLFFFTLFVSTSIFYWPISYSWHDHQRISQLLLVLAAGLMIPWRQDLKINLKYFNTLFLIGLISCILSQYPDWALKEWAKFLLLICLACYISSIEYSKLKKYIFYASIGITTLSSIAFLSFYAAALFEKHALNPLLMYPGFDNPRFYSQFQVLIVPIIFAAIISNFYPKKIKFFPQATLIMQWCILWSLAGRGAILALIITPLILKVFCRKNKVELLKYYCFGSIGLLLFLILFKLTPLFFLDIPAATPTLLRGDSSGRTTLWLYSIDMLKANPFFGAGPMHFASKWHHIFAHPHQALLQIAAEWGAPFLIIACIGVFKYFQISIKKLTSDFESCYFYILSSVAGALILAQFDGVLVMPYTEGWLAIIFGLSLSRLPANKVKANKISHYLYLSMLFLSIFVILKILITEAPYLYETYNIFLRDNIQHGAPPRFWDIGWIPMP